MESNTANSKMVTRLLFRLLPVQILLAAVATVNGLVSTFFATNYLDVDAVSAIGLYAPVSMLITAVSLMLTGGATFLCGKHLGRNEHQRLEDLFASGLAAAAVAGFIFMILYLIYPLTGLSRLTTTDENVVKPFIFYLIGQSMGVIPFMLGNQFAPFLLVENKEKRTINASVAYIATNLLLNIIFVTQLNMGIFGISLASALGMWVFCGVQAEYFISSKSYINYYRKNIKKKDVIDIIAFGTGDAASSLYQTLRGFLINNLILVYIGSVGISAFTAADNFLRIIWSIPTAMLVVSRMLISLSIGEEDRRTLTDVMRNMFRRFVPLMACISLVIVALANPIAKIFYRDTSSAVYNMTVMGLRILPLCMPLSIICMHFVCYASNKRRSGYARMLYILDGVACVFVFTHLLIDRIGMNSVYVANVLNGVVTTLVIIGFAWIKNKHFPKTMDDLMTIEDDFGVDETERMDISVQSIEEVVTIAERIQDFCLKRGIDDRRSHLAGLYMEEMAGNIVDHGFTKDNKKHAIDVRVVHKGDEVILRIKDDCVPFDPRTRNEMTVGAEITKNIGIRMVYKMAKDISYQNIVGMNVLTIKI